MKLVRPGLLSLLVLSSLMLHAQKYKGWYLGLNAGLGHAYLHNKNFDFFINAKGDLEQYFFQNGVKYDRKDPVLNNFYLSFEIEKELQRENNLTFFLGYSTSKYIFHMGTNSSVGTLSTWYPDEKEMFKFQSVTNLSYLQGAILYGRGFRLKKDLKFETKVGIVLGLLQNVDQHYFSKRDTISSFEAKGNNYTYNSVARNYFGQVLLHSVSYSESNRLYNNFIPGFVLQFNFLGKIGAGNAKFEKWRYKIGIYAQADFRDIDGNAWNYFMPPQMEYPNAPSYTIRSGIQFGLSYHFNKR